MDEIMAAPENSRADDHQQKILQGWWKYLER
jgi:hypothetical protein